MFVELSGAAQNDVTAIRKYIAEEGHTPSARAADETVAKILKAIKIPEIFPRFGRRGRVEDTFELDVSTVPYYAIIGFSAPTISLSPQLFTTDGNTRLPMRAPCKSVRLWKFVPSSPPDL